MSITDGTFVCGLCGEWRIGCGLCGEAPLIDMRAEIARKAAEERHAELEARQQERAIRAAADARAGF